MQTDNRFFDDMARVAGGAMGVLSGLKGEIESMVHAQVERILGRMDLVPREDFEAVREMAQRAREEQEALADRVARLEAKLAAHEDREAE